MPSASDAVAKVVCQVVDLDRLNVLVVAHDPFAVLGTHSSDVVAVGRAVANVNNDREELVQALAVVRVLGGAGHPELQREGDAVEELVQAAHVVLPERFRCRPRMFGRDLMRILRG
jgi:hypothetical protein